MAIICGPITETVSSVSKVICGHIVKIYDMIENIGKTAKDIDAMTKKHIK